MKAEPGGCAGGLHAGGWAEKPGDHRLLLLEQPACPRRGEKAVGRSGLGHSFVKIHVKLVKKMVTT